MNNFLPRFFFCLLALSLSSCSRTTTDPMPAFIQVQQEAQARTDEVIQWNNRSIESCDAQCFIAEALSQDLNVDQAVQIALLNNPRLQAMYENLGIAQAELVQAGLLKNPIYDYSIKYDEGLGSKIIEMGILQNILDILLKPLKIRAARAELEITKNEVISDVIGVIAETKMAFYTLLAAEESLKVRKQLLEAAEASYDAAMRLRTAGNITELSLIDKLSQYEQIRIDITQTEIEVVEARERLNILMGLWGFQTDWTICAEMPKIPENSIECAEIEKVIIANSLALENIRRRILETAARIGIDTTEVIFPEIQVGATAEREADGKWFVGPQFAIAIPLFDWGQAQRAKGRAELNHLCKKYIATAIELRSTARATSFKLWNTHRQSLYFEQILIPLAEEITSQTLLQLNAMQLGVFEMLSAKKREIEMRERAIEFIRDYWITRAKVEMLISGRMVDEKMMEWRSERNK